MIAMYMCILMNLMCKTKFKILHINQLAKYKNHKSNIKYKKIKDVHPTRSHPTRKRFMRKAAV